MLGGETGGQNPQSLLVGMHNVSAAENHLSGNSPEVRHGIYCMIQHCHLEVETLKG